MYEVKLNRKKIPTLVVEYFYAESKSTVTATAIADTGADTRICGADLVRKLKIKELINRNPRDKLVGASGKAIIAMGKLKVRLSIKNESYNEDVIVCNKQTEMLRSFNACSAVS